MTESNRQLFDHALPVAPGEYLLNRAKIAEAKALISAYEDMNEAGKQSHDEIARELEQKIREGERAREMLLQLRSQSTLQVPPIRKLAIDYPSSTSRIEEVPNYDPGSGHSQQVQYQQFQGTSNQQTRNFIPQVTVQPIASSSYQQYNPQQWTPGNPNGGQYEQYSQYSQQHIMQNSSTSYTPFGFPSDQGNRDSHSHPVAPTQEQRRVPSHQEPLHYGNSGSSQGQWRTAQMYSPPQTIPVHAPGPSSQAYKSGPSPNIQQSSSTNTYPKPTVSQSQASASGATSEGPLPHKTTNITTQSQLATALGPQPNVSSSNSVPTTSPTQSQLATALGPQPNASSSNPVPVAVTSPNPISTKPIANPNGDQNATHGPYPPLSHIPTTLPSIHMHHTQFIRELREALKNWDAKVPPNSYFDHPSSFFRVFKDPKGAIRIVMRGQGHLHGQSQVVEVDQFCNWIRQRNTTASATPAVPADSQTGASSSTSTPSNAQKAIPSTIHKAIPSTAVKANVQATSSATPHRPGYSERGASSSKQTSSTMPSCTHNQGIARQVATLSTPPQTGSSASQIQLSTPNVVPQPSLSSPWVRPLLPSTAQAPSSAPTPKTPNRQLSTIVNGVPRSAKQADKKSLASHVLFGLGKRRRETETSSTASTEPQPKRHAQQVTGQIVAGVSPSAGYTVGRVTPAVQKPNVPNGASTASSSLQQPLQRDFIPPTIPRETEQVSQASSASPGDRQQPVNVTPEVPSTSKVAAAVEVSEVSKTPLSLQDARIVPPDTSSTVVQLTTQPSPVPLVVPVPVPSKSVLEAVNIPQPVASTVVKQRQASTPVKLELSFTDVPALGTSTEMKNQPLFLPSPVSSPGMDANDDVSISGTQLAYMASRSFDLRKISSSAKRKNHAFVLVPSRPPYLVKYFHRLEKQKISRASLKKEDDIN